MIIPYLTLWERTAGRASSKSPEWQEVSVSMRAAARTVRVRAYMPPQAVIDDFGAVKLDSIIILGIMVAEDVKRLAQDDILTDQGGRTWHVQNPVYAGGGLIKCTLREGASAPPVIPNRDAC